MADAYRGLTIRIGADVTNIQSALRSVTSAASQTQSELSKIKRALRLDPGNLTLADRQMGELGKVAETSYEKLNRMRDAYRALGETKLGNGASLSEFSRGIDNAIADSQKLHERFNSINDELARTYNQVEQISGVKLDDDHIWSDANVKRLNELNIEFDKTKDNAVTVAQKLQDSGFDIPDSTIQHIATLRENFSETQRAMQDMDKAAGFQKMGTDLATLESKAKSAARQLQELNKTSELGRAPGIQQIDQQLESIDRASADTARRLEQVNHALQIDPGNVAAAEQQMVLLANQADLAQKKAQLLSEKLEAYSGTGIERTAQGVTNVAENLEKSRQAAVEAAQAYEEAKGRLADLRQQSDNLSSSSGADKEGAKYRELQARIKAAESEVEQYRAAAVQASGAYESAKAVAEFEQTRQAAAEAEAEVSNLNAQMKSSRGIDWGKASQQMRDVGQSLTDHVTQPLVSLAQSSIQTSTEFDSAFRDMKKTVDGTDEDFARLRQSALDFSTTHVTSADQILEMEAMGGQLGIAVDQLQDFAETASNLDIATDIDADTISQSMGQLVNIMSDLNVTADSTHGGLDNFADSLVRLGNNSPALESQIMDITMRIASQGNIIGMTTPQVLAWSTALASTGQNSEAAGTALSKTMSQIEAAVAGGTSAVADYAEQAGMGVQEFVDKCKNSPKSLDAFAKSIGTTGKKLANEVLKGKGSLQDFADVAGMTADQFAAKWKSEPSAALEDFVKGLKRIDDEGGSMETTLAGLGITAVRQKQGLEGLTQTVDTLDKSLAMSGDAWGGVADQWGDAGDAAREASQKSEGFSGAVGKLKNNWDALKVSIGDGMTPFVEGFSGAAQGLSKWFGGLSDDTKQFVVAVGGIAAAAGPAIIAIGAIGTAISAIVSNVALLPAVLGIAAVGAVAAFAISAEEARKKDEEFRESLESLGDTASDTASLSNYRGAISDFGEKSHDAAKSVDDFRKSVEDHAAAQRETTEAAKANISTLNAAQQAIDDSIGKTDLSVSQLGRLKWAIGVVNEQLGTNISVEDALSGTFKDQAGNIQDLRSELDRLIQKRKEEIQEAAAQSNLEDSYKGQREAIKQEIDARKELADAIKEQYKAEQAGDPVAYHDATEKVDEAKKKVDDARASYDAYTDSIHTNESALGMSAKAAEDAGDAYENAIGKALSDADQGARINGWMESNRTTADQLAQTLRDIGVSTEDVGRITADQWSQIAQDYDGSTASIVGDLKEFGIGVTDAGAQAQTATNDIANAIRGLAGASLNLGQAKISVDELAGKLQAAGVTAEQMGNITASAFNMMVYKSGGDINKLVALIASYNSTPIDPKSTSIDIGGLDLLKRGTDEAITWNGTELVYKDTGITVEGGTEIQDALGNIWVWNGTELVPKTCTVDADGNIITGEAQDHMSDFSGSEDTMHSATYTVDANGNAIDGTAQAGIQNTSGAASGLQAYSGHVITIDAQGNAIDLTAKYGIDLTQGSISALTGKSVTADVSGSATDASLPGTIGGVTTAIGGMTDKSVTADVNGNVIAGLALSAIGFVVGALAGLVDKTATAQYVGNAVDGSAIGSLQASAGALAAMVSRSVTASVTGNAVDGGAATQVRQATSAINSMQTRTVQAQVNGNASDGSGKAQVDATKASIDSLASKTVSANVTGNAVNGSAAGAIRSTAAAINSLSSRSVTVTVTHRNVTINETQTVTHARGGVRLNASGGIVGAAPRYLSSGAVYTRPTYIDPHNLIAEAGPEYYDGNHIVPLSGRYGKDFAGTIADAIADRYGGADGRPQTTNVYIDGARVNDDAAIEGSFYEFMSELFRIYEMR